MLFLLRRNVILLFILAAVLPLSLCAEWPKGHTSYRTEPTFTPLVVEVTIHKEGLAPGYVFLTPNGKQVKGGFYGGYGLHIFDMDGELIWYGNDTANHRALRGHVCDYLGQKDSHICWHDGARIRKTFNYGHIRFFDNAYEQVGEVHAEVGQLDEPDGHEVNTVDKGEHLMQDIYQRQYVNVSKHEGWLLDCCFQDVNLRTGELEFQWCAMDHIPICDYTKDVEGLTCWANHGLGGNGKRWNSWDFWHMNSADKNEEGDYMVSIRHLGFIMKIAGNNNVHGVEPGSPLWVLNGEHGTIDMKGFMFSGQHVARFLNTTSTTTTLSVLDNAKAGGGHEATLDHSRALIIEVNNQTNTARVLQKYPHPEKHRSHSAGNAHVLDNGNMFVGWGHLPSYSEFSEDGTALYHAKFVGDSPQAWKFPWVGTPKTKPKILAYSLNCSETPVYAYLSWNGATELKQWEVYASNNSDRAVGPWEKVASAEKKTFETRVKLDTDSLYFYVAAYDASHELLEESDVVTLFVPNKKQSENCDQHGCIKPERFTYDKKWSVSEQCPGVVVSPDNGKGASYPAAESATSSEDVTSTAVSDLAASPTLSDYAISSVPPNYASSSVPADYATPSTPSDDASPSDPSVDKTPVEPPPKSSNPAKTSDWWTSLGTEMIGLALVVATIEVISWLMLTTIWPLVLGMRNSATFGEYSMVDKPVMMR